MNLVAGLVQTRVHVRAGDTTLLCLLIKGDEKEVQVISQTGEVTDSGLCYNILYVCTCNVTYCAINVNTLDQRSLF